MPKNFDSTYIVCKWLQENSLRNKITRIKDMDFKNKGKSSDSGLLDAMYAILGLDGRKDASQVEKFWSQSENGLKDISNAQLKGCLILQAVFRSWLMLKKIRMLWRLEGHSVDDKNATLQGIVRVWKARQKLLELAKEKLANELEFKVFCDTLAKGKQVIMFGKKYGINGIRTLQFDDTKTSLMYKASTFNTRKVPLSQIFKITLGLSGFSYPLARVKHRGWCFHLELLGGKVLDFEAIDKTDTNFFVKGIKRLRMLTFTQGSFFVDKNGVPRRAGPSVIDMARERSDDGFSSEAAEMRFRMSLKSLLREYEKWTAKEKEEIEVYENALEEYNRKVKARQAALAAATGITDDDPSAGGEDNDDGDDGLGNDEQEELVDDEKPTVIVKPSFFGRIFGRGKKSQGDDEDVDKNAPVVAALAPISPPNASVVKEADGPTDPPAAVAKTVAPMTKPPPPPSVVESQTETQDESNDDTESGSGGTGDDSNSDSDDDSDSDADSDES